MCNVFLKKKNNEQINTQRRILEASCDMKGNKQKQIAYPHVNG